MSVCEVKSFPTVKIFSSQKDIEQDMKTIGENDCWGVYTKGAETKSLKDDAKTVFCHLRYCALVSCEEDCIECKKSYSITDNPLPLINQIDDGRLVVFVIGFFDTVEYTYTKIGETYIRFSNIHL